ncbi:MAG: MFS transporter [Xenococcaceae cyanobacterium MO_207.B15]|nr:MFS transporter [Xenococcaceae cyanobacterium MO_207.B15]
MKTEKLNFTTKLAYGSGDMGPAITANILVFFLLYFFTNVAGLPPGLAGSILAIGKIGDAINDPIAGILSDRTRTKWGRRIPWMLWGTIPFGVFFFLQWIVPEFSSDPDLNQWCLFVYYILIAIVFNLAYTAVNLPYTALTPELTQDYNERTNINSFRFAFSIGGSILSLILATFIFQAYPDNPRQQYLILGLVSTVLSIIALFWCTFRIQERGAEPILKQPLKRNIGYILIGIAVIAIIYSIINLASAILFGLLGFLVGLQLLGFGITLIWAKTESHLCDRDAIEHRNTVGSTPTIPILEQLKIVFRNKPFLYLIGIYLCSWLAVQLTASILIYFVVSWMGMDEAAFPTVAIAVQGTALIMLFFWKFVSSKIGKKAVYYMGTGFWIIAQGGLFLLQPEQTTELYLLATLAGFGVSVAYLVPWSMIPDVIELDELNTGQRREGIYYSFMVLLQKFGLALALFLVGLSLEWSGFIERQPGGEIPVQPDSALLAIRVAVAPLPTVVLIIGLVLAYFYPITKEVHEEIRLKLQARKNKEGMKDSEGMNDEG